MITVISDIAKKRKCTENDKRMLMEHTSHLDPFYNLKDRKMIILGEKPNVCEICKQPSHQSYRFCSVSCSNKDSQKSASRQSAVLEKYGVINVSQLKEVKEKVTETCLDRYGAEHPAQNKEICEKIKQTNIERYGVAYSFLSDATKEQIKQTNIERYGVDNPFKSEAIKEKIKQTNIERYGVDNPALNETIKEKIKQTNLERYGVDNPALNETIKEKIKQTNLERYGVECSFTSDLIKEKIKQTNLERYGVEYPFQSQEICEKRKETFLERYGVDHPMKTEDMREKIKETCLKRYGVDHPMKSYGLQEKIKQTNLERYGVEYHQQRHLKDHLVYLNDSEWWSTFNTMSEIKTALDSVLGNYSIYKYTREFRPELISDNCFISMEHQRIMDLLDENNILYEVNNRTLINPLEIDIYIPSYQLAIEINGLYWHSELRGKTKNYHINKTDVCEKKGITLLQFWDTEITQQWSIVSSIILSKCYQFKVKLGARRCVVKNVGTNEERLFLNENHLQGYCRSEKAMGLYYGNVLMALMTFGKPRFNKNVDCELLRFCSRVNHQINGAAFKLFKHRPKGRIISYADRRFSKGAIYKTLGFSFQKNNVPAYYYTKDYMMLYNRVKFQKHKLPQLLDTFDPLLTEWENMVANGFDRVWNCGTSVFILE